MKTATFPAFALAAMVAVCAGARAGEDAGKEVLQAQCFSSSALAAVAGEHIATRNDHRPLKPPEATPVLSAPAIAPEFRGSIRRVELQSGKKLVALTFDLCEDRGQFAGYDGRIVDYLRANKVRATFFAGGKWMRSHPARTMQLMSDPLFEIANHSEAHRNFRLLSANALTNEILGPQRTYETIRQTFSVEQCFASNPDAIKSIPSRLSLFRFPYGACNPQAMAAVNEAGLLAIQWDISTGDPDPRQSAQAIARAMKSAKPGSILIAHANGRGWQTANALPLAIPAMRAEGFEFVTVSELLAAGKPVIAETCYDSRPGDTNRYDTLLSLAARQKSLYETTTVKDVPWITQAIKSKSARKKDDDLRDQFFPR